MDGWVEAKAGLRIAYSNQKLPTYVFEAPFAGRFEKGGVCQSAQNGPVGKFFNFFPHKNQN